MLYTTTNEQQTKNLAEQFAATLCGGDIVVLHGDLGAGKTRFVKGLAKRLGITEDILSPTFTLMNVYQVRSPKSEVRTLVHIDTYRLKNEQELINIGVEDYLGDPHTICVIEWPEKLPNLLANKKTVSVTIEHVGEERRKITISSSNNLSL